jgi:hypothetical protein
LRSEPSLRDFVRAWQGHWDGGNVCLLRNARNSNAGHRQEPRGSRKIAADFNFGIAASRKSAAITSAADWQDPDFRQALIAPHSRKVSLIEKNEQELMLSASLAYE